MMDSKEEEEEEEDGSLVWVGTWGSSVKGKRGKRVRRTSIWCISPLKTTGSNRKIKGLPASTLPVPTEKQTRPNFHDEDLREPSADDLRVSDPKMILALDDPSLGMPSDANLWLM